MRDLISIAAIVASAAAVPAVPAGKGTFSIPQVLAGHVIRSPPIEMLETYHKYSKAGIRSIEIPADVSRAAEAARLVKRGSVQANPNHYDSYYLSPVNVGGTVLNMLIGTASAELWAYSKDLPTSTRGEHHVYTPSSSAKRLEGYTWNVTYGEGSSVSGIVYSDTVVIGGITAHNQAVEVATNVSAGFSNRADVDGVLGLGFKTLNYVEPTQQNTIFDTIKSQLAKPLFTVDLKVRRPGSYDFGYINPKKHKGIVTYVPVDTDPGYWKFTAGAYSAGKGKPAGSVGVAFLDSGTTFLWLPAEVVTDYYSHVPTATYDTSIAGWTFPCKGTVLPDFHVVVGSQTFTVPGKILNYGPVDDANSPTCFGQIVDNKGLGGQTIFGMVWIRAEVFEEGPSGRDDELKGNDPSLVFVSGRHVTSLLEVYIARARPPVKHLGHSVKHSSRALAHLQAFILTRSRCWDQGEVRSARAFPRAERAPNSSPTNGQKLMEHHQCFEVIFDFDNIFDDCNTPWRGLSHHSLSGRPFARPLELPDKYTAHRDDHSFSQNARNLYSKHPISVSVAVLAMACGVGGIVYANYLYQTYILESFHKYPEPVAQKLRRALYFTNIDLQPKEAIKYYRQALEVANELEMDPFSDEIIGVKIQVAALMESIQQWRRAIEVLERVRSDNLAWIEQFGVLERNKKRRTNVLAKTVGISVKLGELYGQPAIWDRDMAQERLVWAVETVLKEQTRRQNGNVKDQDEGTWMSGQEIGAALEALAHSYEEKEQHYLAAPLFLQALNLYPTKDCHSVVLMNNLASSLAQQSPRLAREAEAYAASRNINAKPTGPAASRESMAENAKMWAQKALDIAASITPPVRNEECDMGCAVATHNLGEFAEMSQNYEEAKKRYEEAIALSRAIGFEEGVEQSSARLRDLKKV
ncbi:unnamed protein product [Zymoseptoria tritici ST99CH_3D1]|nr:unnamed protein product [Zymoseptoria tritici ST99CH_3D1]